MPVQLGSKLPTESAEARIEIIPLIDIMFFLLAAFMLVSLSMVNLKTMKVNLPTATAANSQTKKDLVDISIDKSGGIFLDKKPVGINELALQLASQARSDPDLKVLISGDKDGLYGQVIHVLDVIRSVGIEKVSFEIRPPKSKP